MKKLLMAAVFLCAIFVSHGQKQQTDSKTLEVNFTPFGNSPVSLNSLKFRKFSSDYSAIRLGLWISSDSDRDVIANTGSLGDDNNSNPTLNRKHSEFGRKSLESYLLVP